jgi:RecA/RadA recombinase
MGVLQLYHNIKKGKEGKNLGISTNCPKLDDVLNGIQRKYMYIVAGDTGSGKSSYALDVFVYNLYKNKDKNKDKRPVHFLYYSFEMASEVLLAKILSLHIWDTYQKVIPFKSILSLDKIISDENYKLVMASQEWLIEFSKTITIYDSALTPGGIYATCKNWLSEFGEFIKLDEHKEEYREYDSLQYNVVIIDHISLIAGPDTKKSKIDTVCDYMIGFRNKCNITPVIVQQTNRNSKSMDRKLNGYELFSLDDLMDSSATGQAAEVVLMLYYPYREKIAKCEGYPIQSILKDRFRLVQICKNRFGLSDKNIGNVFYGEIGMFKELPRPQDIIDYDDYINLEKTEFTI